MIVTINTDASYNHRHQIGSYAFWIVSDRFKVLKSGVLRKKVSRPEMAEFRCIINALHALCQEDIQAVHKIIVNTDCMNVIHLVKNDRLAIKQYRLNWGTHLVALFDCYRRELGKRAKRPVLIELRHVRAHTDNTDARSFVNDWCDRSAKQALSTHLIDLIGTKNLHTA